MISIICVNADIIHTAVHGTSTLARFDFMKLLANKTHEKKTADSKMPSEIRKIKSDTFPGSGQHRERKLEQTDRLDKRKAWRYCPYEKHRMTNYKCIKCEPQNCLESSKKLCTDHGLITHKSEASDRTGANQRPAISHNPSDVSQHGRACAVY
ncbi:hypothetical protein PR048_009499 [Dryococelus australis]|uniref:C2H2-type domain-containing protein n=1 Tax=Dryococelus australis TaxID=614101 RepID=A0ABQ9I040_9NEOP|nr:hypothetical protein PR048_009499 [Dryococelus australis]